MFPFPENPTLVHSLFEAVALSSGAFYYRSLQKRAGVHVGALLRGGRLAVLLGCIVGAAIGNKLVFWLEFPQLFPLYWNRPELWAGGQSLVGGLLGGLLGVELAKRAASVQYSTGDAFVFPILLGLMIGRVGCFLSGPSDGTFGVPTTLPWGVDFGDGTPRHPTQLYEIAFAALLWVSLSRMRPRWAAQPGLLFKAMLCSYLLWRLWVDTLKPVPFDYGFGWSGIQWICALALLVYMPFMFMQWRRLEVRA